MLKLNKINVNELIDSNDCLYSNRNDVELNIDNEGYYKIKCIGDSIIDSIEYVGKEFECNYDNVLDDVVGVKDDYEYVNIKKDYKMIKVNRSEIKEINVNDVNKFIDSNKVNLNSSGWKFEEVYKGEGIYEIEIGSRGEINDIVLNDEFESIEEMKRKDKDYEEEFYFVSNYGNYIEFGLYEEYSGIFINVVGEVK